MEQNISIADNIVHESEAQRQYVRMPIPARAIFNNQTYTVKDLSSGGLGLSNIEGVYKKGHEIEFKLVFPFPEFALETALTGQVQNYDIEKQSLGVRFINLTPAQVSIINHIIRAFVSGDVVVAKDILDVAQRNDFVKIRSQKSAHEQGQGASPKSIKTILPLMMIGLIGLSALTFIVQNIYSNVAFVTASTAYIDATSLPVRTPYGGVFNPMLVQKGQSVKKGQIIAKVNGSVLGWRDFIVKSPCDCYVLSRPIQSGEYVQAGQSVFELLPLNAQPKIVAQLSASDATKIKAGELAQIRIADHEGLISGIVENIIVDQNNEPMSIANQGAMARVNIQVDKKLPLNMVGWPVSARFKVY